MNLKIILRLMDPRTLVASFVPVLYGSIFSWFAFNKINLLFLFLMLIALILVQSSANMFNDFSDFNRNADTEKKGDEKALVNGEITPTGVLRLIFIYMAVAFCIALFLAFSTNLMIMIPIAIGGLIIFLYSSGPFPICYTPFGELIAGLTMGTLATVTIIYLQSGLLNFTTVLVTIPTTCFISMLLLSNNIGDWVEDAEVGRKTLPIVLGIQKSEMIWASLLFAMYISLLLFAVLNIISIVIAAIGIGSFPFKQLSYFMKIKKQKYNKPQLMKLAGSVGLRFHVIIISCMVAVKLFF